MDGSSMTMPNRKEKASNSKEDSISQLLILVGTCGGGFVCLKYWFAWCCFAFGVGGYGLLGSDVICFRSTAEDPDLVTFQCYMFVLRIYRFWEIAWGAKWQ